MLQRVLSVVCCVRAGTSPVPVVAQSLKAGAGLLSNAFKKKDLMVGDRVIARFAGGVKEFPAIVVAMHVLEAKEVKNKKTGEMELQPTRVKEAFKYHLKCVWRCAIEIWFSSFWSVFYVCGAAADTLTAPWKLTSPGTGSRSTCAHTFLPPTYVPARCSFRAECWLLSSSLSPRCTHLHRVHCTTKTFCLRRGSLQELLP